MRDGNAPGLRSMQANRQRPWEGLATKPVGLFGSPSHSSSETAELRAELVSAGEPPRPKSVPSPAIYKEYSMSPQIPPSFERYLAVDLHKD